MKKRDEWVKDIPDFVNALNNKAINVEELRRTLEERMKITVECDEESSFKEWLNYAYYADEDDTIEIYWEADVLYFQVIERDILHAERQAVDDYISELLKYMNKRA